MNKQCVECGADIDHDYRSSNIHGLEFCSSSCISNYFNKHALGKYEKFPYIVTKVSIHIAPGSKELSDPNTKPMILLVCNYHDVSDRDAYVEQREYVRFDINTNKFYSNFILKNGEYLEMDFINKDEIIEQVKKIING